jgi:glycosyltransferase involved in cell wall biosynthesis
MAMDENVHIPRVSVAMATYNGASWLPAQIESVLSQSVSDLELVIVDDASVDDTRAVLEKYKQTDNRIRLIFNGNNIGYQETFYKALSACRGQYILFCDQDDIWMTDKIGTLIGELGENLLIFSDSVLMDEKGKDTRKKLSDTVNMHQPGTRKINRGFVIGNCVWGHTILFHRSLLEHATQQVIIHPPDWWFAVVSSHLQKVRFCPLVLNRYRQHAKNLTQAIPKKQLKRRKIAGRKLEEYHTQLTRLASIKDLPFNSDKLFYMKWHELHQRRKKGFSFTLLYFLLSHRKDIFCMKRKNFISQMIAIRKMCRAVK